MSDRLKAAIVAALTSVIVAVISTGAIQARQKEPVDKYKEERALILYRLNQIDARTQRIERAVQELQYNRRR